MNDFKILPNSSGFSVAHPPKYWMIFNDTIEPVIPQEDVFQRDGKFYYMMPQAYIGCYGPPTKEIEVYEKMDAWKALLRELLEESTKAINTYSDAVNRAVDDGFRENLP